MFYVYACVGELLYSLEQAVEVQSASFNSQEVTNLLWSFGKLGEVSTDTLRILEGRVLQISGLAPIDTGNGSADQSPSQLPNRAPQKFSFGGLSLCLWGLVSLHHTVDPKMQVCDSPDSPDNRYLSLIQRFPCVCVCTCDCLLCMCV